MQEVSVKNLGPIEELSFGLSGHGVTILTAPNGSGKSILIDALQKMSKRSGTLPLRDSTRRGEVSAFGATVTIGARANYKGEFEVLSLGGRCDLATLVDPGIKDPEAADKARIKAMVNLTGVEPDLELFRSRAEFVDFDELVGGDLECSDLIDAAAKVKRAYEKEARTREDAAERAAGHASGYRERIGEIDTDEDADLEAARKAHMDAVAELSRMEQARRSYEEHEADRAKSRERLAEIKANRKGPSTEELQEGIASAVGMVNAKQELVNQLEDQLRAANQELTDACTALDSKRVEFEEASRREKEIASLEEVLSNDQGPPVSEAQVENSREAVSRADAEYSRVKTLLDAKELARMAQDHESTASHHREMAESLRKAAKATDDVISSAIPSSTALRVVTEDGKTRLVTDHPKRGKDAPFGEFSEGERWKIAIDLGADQVGENGLLVIPQEAWESLDCYTRPVVHQHAVERKVYILTAEATRDETDGRTIKAKEFAHAS